jgi:hypothetical protein
MRNCFQKSVTRFEFSQKKNNIIKNNMYNADRLKELTKIEVQLIV